MAWVSGETATGLSFLSDFVGWIYFVCWSASFYPQVWVNWRRKSVVGLSFNFLALNITGHTCYCIYTLILYFDKHVQHEYARRYRGSNPVEINDVVFTVHAVTLTLITIGQCCVYERGGQRVAKGILLAVAVVLAAAALLLVLVAAVPAVTLLMWIMFLSYVKLGITLVKYIPQAWMNYRRQSTRGWSIWNVLLDLSGGFFSFVQMFLQSIISASFGNFTGGVVKVGLALISIAFDLFFMLQHYVFYRGGAAAAAAASTADHDHDAAATVPIATARRPHHRRLHSLDHDTSDSSATSSSSVSSSTSGYDELPTLESASASRKAAPERLPFAELSHRERAACVAGAVWEWLST